MQHDGQLPSSAIVGLMAKFWEPGRVKTRLGASIGMERAADLHHVFVHHLLCELGAKAGQPRVSSSLDSVSSDSSSLAAGDHESGQGRAVNQNWALHWVATPPNAINHCLQQVEQWNLDGVSIADQGDGDLGNRMHRWFMNGSQANRVRCENARCEKAVLIGADCPLLLRSDIADALKRLDDSDLVLGPAADGGYYLIGLNFPLHADVHRIFSEMVWSRDDVFDVTCHRAKELGMTLSVLPTREDVDTQSDLDRLRQSLAHPECELSESAKQFRDNIDRIMHRPI